MRSYQGFTFSTRIQDGIPRDNQRDEKQNVWHVEKPQRVFIEFYGILSGLHFFPHGSRMGSQRTTKETKREMSGRQKNLNIFLLNSKRSIQDFTFPIRIQDGIPRDNQRDEKENVWQVKKPERLFIEFYEVLSGLHFFPPGSRMGSQGTTKGTKSKTSDM